MMQLGILQEQAALRGDDRAAVMLSDIAELLGASQQAVERDQQRRAADRSRQHRHRKPDGHVTSRDVTLQHVTNVTPSPLFPPSRALPSLSPHPEEDNTPRAREATAQPRSEAVRADTPSQRDELIERYAAMLHEAMGDEFFRDADAFVKRRSYEAWRGWFREMLALIGPGSQYVATDLAQVCRDDAALERPIGTPKGLRAFLASVRAERMSVRPEPNGQPKANGKPSNVLSNRGVLMYGKIRDLITTTSAPGQSPHQMIPKAKVAQLGADVLKAYEHVGGASRFLNVASTDVGFLIRDFSQALEEQQHGHN